MRFKIFISFLPFHWRNLQRSSFPKTRESWLPTWKLERRSTVLLGQIFTLNQLNKQKETGNSQPVAVCAGLNAKTTLNASISVVRKKMWMYKCGNDAWHVHSLRHGHTNWHTCTKPYKQAEKGQLLTGPRLIRTQFHNFLLYFWEQKKKNKNKVWGSQKETSEIKWFSWT